jgi:hypothetical protein
VSNNPYVIELFLFSGAALAWGFYELWTVRKSQRGDKPTSSDTTGHPEG